MSSNRPMEVELLLGGKRATLLVFREECLIELDVPIHWPITLLYVPNPCLCHLYQLGHVNERGIVRKGESTYPLIGDGVPAICPSFFQVTQVYPVSQVAAAAAAATAHRGYLELRTS